jgi:PAS domain S-box-containing protein
MEMAREYDAMGHPDFLSGGGEMGARIRAFEWSQTPLGPVDSWPQSLRSATSILLSSRAQIVLFWGPDLIALYNDAYAPVFGSKHPWAMGKPARECWAEIWKDTLAPLFSGVLESGAAFYAQDYPFFIERHGYPEETYFDVSYDPVRAEDGAIGGIFCIVTETTVRVLERRRLQTLRALSSQSLLEFNSDKEVCQLAAKTIGENNRDVPFALIYLIDDDRKTARLEAAAGIEEGTPISPLAVELDAGSSGGVWPLEKVTSSNHFELVDTTHIPSLPFGAWNEAPRSVLILPVAAPGQNLPTALVAAAVSPRRPLDDAYQNFYHTITGYISTSLASARAYEAERKRADSLAELDRAKTTFFSNVSHEFRTPLTLILGPMEELLATPADSLGPKERGLVDMMHRNGLRLLKLVNSLLDFSSIEAGRMQAVYEPTDLGRLTSDLTSVFSSAVEQAGLKLIVDCPPLEEPVYVDREMWEKIVLNLVSNALKFTFEGAITVSLNAAGPNVELVVRDTGTGIAESELPHLFERFHRIRGAQARTHEGTGIGLALVQELVKLHSGSVRVESAVGEGTTFSVSIPASSTHLPADRIGQGRAPESNVSGAGANQRAMRWAAPELQVDNYAVEVEAMAGAEHPARPFPARILLADDSADMREYLGRILRPYWTVEAVPDGKAALESARAKVPDLVLSDVMMPRLDGFELVRELRNDPLTRRVPIVLLSARAGEESKVEGLTGGADDYLAKPFSSRELVARVGAHLEMARVRGEAEIAIRESEEQLRRAAEFGEAVMKNMGEGLYTVDSQGLVTSMNPAAEKLFGWSFDEIRGLKMHDVTHYKHRDGSAFPGEDCAALQVLREGGMLIDNEDAFIRKDGTFFDVIYSSSPLRESGKIAGLVVVFRDITERKRTEEDREKLFAREQAARQEAEEASRLKDEFLATVSHELRSPLNAIMGWANILRTGKLDPESAANAVQTIERNARSQAQLIEDLLDVSRIISGKLRLNVEPVYIMGIIEAAIESVRPAAEAKNVRLQTVLEPDAGPVSGDGGRLQQVVWNLLANAVKFTPRGGLVQVRLARINSHIEIVVSDTGQGIVPEFLPYVFDRFRQADGTSTRPHGGLGLGLSIVRHITELHGGRVTADSPGQGRGATFAVELPIMAIHKINETERVHPCVDRETRPGFERLPSLAGIKVVVVDDEAETLLLLSTVLTQCGASVKTAAAAEEGFRAVQAWRPNLIVSDIGMPLEDGYSFIKRVKEWTRQAGTWIPAVALTAYARAEDRMKILASGYQMHVAKPVDVAELLAVIVSLIERPTTPWTPDQIS